MQESDWDGFLQRLKAETRQAIERFSAENPDKEVCYFAYDSEPCYGYVLTCFNSSESSVKYVRDWHDRSVRYCGERLAKDAWRNCAYYQVKANAVLPFCDNTGDFDYQGFSDINFPEWESLAASEHYPQVASHEDDYLQSRVVLIFWRALQELADEGAFAKLKLASPTLLGFGFHDDDMVVVRMLNIP